MTTPAMRVLRLAREPSDKRTGVFTSGIVATRDGRKIALYFTGRQHAGENLAGVLRQRAAALAPPIQMSDALSRNVPKLASGTEIMIANCLAHGRRQFPDIVQNFPAECRYVLECWAESMDSKRKCANEVGRRPNGFSFISGTVVP